VNQTILQFIIFMAMTLYTALVFRLVRMDRVWTMLGYVMMAVFLWIVAGRIVVDSWTNSIGFGPSGWLF